MGKIALTCLQQQKRFRGLPGEARGFRKHQELLKTLLHQGALHEVDRKLKHQRERNRRPIKILCGRKLQDLAFVEFAFGVKPLQLIARLRCAGEPVRTMVWMWSAAAAMAERICCASRAVPPRAWS